MTITDTSTTDTTTTTNTTTSAPTLHHPDPDAVLATLRKRSFALLASTSPAGRPHVAGVSYDLVDRELWISTMRDSRKARNVDANPHVAVEILVRRLPVGPPLGVHFQTTATVVDLDDGELRRLADAGRLPNTTGHGELELPGGCYLRVALPARLHTYGLGMSLWSLIRNPLDAAGVVELA